MRTRLDDILTKIPTRYPAGEERRRAYMALPGPMSSAETRRASAR
jgi:hypothetical protein